MHLLPGLGISSAIALSAIALAQVNWLEKHGLSALTLAIILGILIGHTVYPRFALKSAAGVDFSKQKLLRLGVVLYGLRLTLQDISHVGFVGVAIDALMLSSTFLLACLIGRWLGIERKTSILIGAGSAICGAAAVIATEPIVRARTEQVTIAIATVVIFGTVAIFLYPVLYALNQQWLVIPASTHGFGIYVGSTIHEVAQVVAIAHLVGPDTAVITKMVRVMMLAPFLILLSAWLARQSYSENTITPSNAHISTNKGAKSTLAIPWFAFGFVGVVILNSFHWLPTQVVTIAIAADTVLLAMAMAALGLVTHVRAIRQAGMKSLFLAAVLFAWLVIGGAFINHWVLQLLA